MRLEQRPKGIGIRRRDQVRGSRCAKPSQNHRGGRHRGLVGGVCIWIYEAIVWVWAQHQMPLIGIPGDATGLVFGKEVQQALGSFWYLLGTAVCGAVSETRKLAAILVTDVVGQIRLDGADARAPAALRSDLFDPAISPHRHSVRRARQKLLLRPLLRRYAGLLVVTD